jgi:hypothetical protein
MGRKSLFIYSYVATDLRQRPPNSQPYSKPSLNISPIAYCVKDENGKYWERTPPNAISKVSVLTTTFLVRLKSYRIGAVVNTFLRALNAF